MTHLLIAALLGCAPDYSKPSRPAPTYTDPGIGQGGRGNTLALIELAPELSLPDDSRPQHTDIQTRWTLPLAPDPKSPQLQKATLPFGIGNPRGYPPAGVQVFVDVTPVPYASRGRHRWGGSGRHLELSWPGKPSEVIVEWPDLANQIARMNFADSGLEGPDFIRWSATRKGDTRQGLMLPAPATASYAIDVPADAPRFKTWLAMEKTPLPGDVSDGAMAVIEVEVDGATTEVARHNVRPKGQTYTPFEADLAPWAGKHITLRLRTEPGGTADHDYVFWGSPSVWGRSEGGPSRVVVIGIDTTRPDHFGFYGFDKPTSPEMDALAANSVVFDRAWTPAPRTRPSFRSATTGRYPLDAVGATNIGEVFREHGYATGGFVANVHLQPRFGFHNGYDHYVYDNGATADTQVNRALTFMRQHPDQDTYVFLHLLDPHIFYAAPGAWRDKFVTVQSDLPARANRWDVYKRLNKGTLSDDDKQFLEQRYEGEIAYTSYEIGRFFSELDAMGGRSLVIVHSDHGEEFFEHGGFEHNHALYNDTTKALLMVRPGTGFEGGRRVDTAVTLYDIAPTLFDYAGFPREDWPELDGQSLRPLIEGKPASEDWDRDISVGHLRYGHEQWGVVHDNHKYLFHTGTGKEELYALGSDPGEQVDIAAKTDLGPWRNALADSHDMAVCPGFRVHANLKANGEPFVFELPEPPIAVEILDPERAVESPANQAWGLPPTRTPDEVGAIDWTPGSTTFTYTPGSNPRPGQIFVFFDKAGAPVESVSARRGSADGDLLSFAPGDNGMLWAIKGERLLIEPSVVISPPPGEASRMRALSALQHGDAAGEDLAMLQELGYLGDDHGEEEAPEPVSPEGSDGTAAPAAAPAERGALRAPACRW